MQKKIDKNTKVKKIRCFSTKFKNSFDLFEIKVLFSNSVCTIDPIDKKMFFEQCKNIQKNTTKANMVKNEYLKILQSPRKNVEIFIFLIEFQLSMDEKYRVRILYSLFC